MRTWQEVLSPGGMAPDCSAGAESRSGGSGSPTGRPAPESKTGGKQSRRRRSAQAIDALAIIAHELRTPLASVHATVDLLNEMVDADPAEARGLLHRLRRIVLWMESLTENVAMWTALEASRLRLSFSRVSVLEVIDFAVSAMQLFTARKRQHVRVVCPDPSPVVRGEGSRLAQVLVNLLCNASTYGPEADTIEINVSERDRWVDVRVVDHGPGVSVASEQDIFRPYVRGSAAVQYPAGVGLGLHVVNTLIELHGGTSGVDSIPGAGASFWFRLPSWPGPEEDACCQHALVQVSSASGRL